MSRNGSGTFSVPNTFTASTPITAAAHNANWADIASEMTNSVAADGQTSMTGPLKAASGTVSAPGIAFASDTNTGLYRIGADNLGIAVNGAKVVDVATTGVSFTGDVAASGAVKQGGFALIPVGFGPAPWSGLSAPDGWVFVGQTLNRADFPALWSFAETEIAGGNTFYTNGNGTTTFTIKSMAGRVPAGKEASASVLTSTYFGGNSTVLGATGGSESHANTVAQIPTLTASGTGTATAPNSKNFVTGTGSQTEDLATGVNQRTIALSQSANATTAAVEVTTTTSGTGGATGNAHNNTQPTIIVNYIIFAGV